jgi:tetrahydromethanopterin S-methyltransferase subunit E
MEEEVVVVAMEEAVTVVVVMEEAETAVVVMEVGVVIMAVIHGIMQTQSVLGLKNPHLDIL